VTHADSAAYQRFVGATRGYWRGPLFRTFHAEASRAPGDAADLVTHRYFAWLERHLQRMKYSGPHGLAALAQRRRETLVAELTAPLPAGLLHVDPALVPPDYCTDYDIHQQPGGLAQELGAHIYRDAVSGGVVGTQGLHERFAARVVREHRPRRVLDLGCGFGRSTRAFAQAAPDAHVDGVDIAASCVTLAAQDTAPALHGRVRFLQAEVTSSGLPAASYDLVTSTMLLHEMPEPAVRALIRETARLLAPGGVVAHLDFLPPSDPALRLLFEGHARRNNEPYLLEHSRIDLERAYADAGFASVETRPFDEEDGALDTPPRAWRLPWHTIVAKR